MDEPTPRRELDNQLVTVIRAYRATQRIAHWSLVFVSLIAIVSLVVSLTVSASQTSTAQHTVTTVVSAQCAFYQALGTAPVPAAVTPLGVKIVVDSRNAYVGLGCTDRLSIPSPALVQDAAKYGLVLKG